MDIIEEYENYLYKRVFASAEAFGYPLSVIEKVMNCYEHVYYAKFYDKEILTKSVLSALNYHLDYSYTDELEFLNYVYKLRSKFVKNSGSCIDIATMGIVNNYEIR